MSVRVVRRAAPAKKKPNIGRLIRNTLVLLFVLVSVAFLGGSLYFFNLLQKSAGLVHTMPDKMAETISTPTTITSADGRQLFSMATEYRKHVPFEDIPDLVKETTLAAEDIRFYQHQGVDLIAMARILLDAASGGRRRGGSTITMQLAKQYYTGNDITYERKLDQMALAVQIERLMTKDLILDLYLNQSYYGEGAYGVGAAAEVYFGKDLKELTLSDAALLARLVRRPSDQNPRENLKVAIFNRNVVLKIMLDEGLIKKDEYDKAINERPKIIDHARTLTSGKSRAPYFVDYVLREIKRVLPGIDVKKGGYTVETTLNYKVQQNAENSMERVINGWRSIRTGAAIVLDKDGRVRAMVGGPSYKENQYNGAVSGRRQPGSSFKPFVYLTAAQQGILGGPYSSVDNSQIFYRENGRSRTVKGGGPDGQVSLISALTYSYNRAAWNTIRRVGPAQVVRLAKNELGFTSDLPAVPSLSLGSGSVSPIEMAQAYSVFPLKGRRVTAYSIERIIGPNGLPVYVGEPTIVKTSFSPRAAEVVDRCLRDVVVGRGGTGAAAGGIANARGKTGTTNDNKDAWFAGYTEEYIGVVWFANPIKSPKGVNRYYAMDAGVMGGKVAAPTWASIMRSVQANIGEERVRLTWPNLSGGSRDYDEEPERPRRRTREDPDGDGVVAPGEIPTDLDVTEERDRAAEELLSERRKRNRANEEIPPVNITPGTEAGDPASGDGATAPASEPRRTPPPRREEPKPEPPKPRVTESEEVSVSVCADSGQRATVYCPEKVTRRFRRGTEPRGRCPVHGGNHAH